MKTLVLTLAVTLGLLNGPAETADVPLPTPVPTPVPAVISVCADTEGHTIDPAYLSDGDSGDYLQHLYEGLMKYAPASTHEVMNERVLTYGIAQSAEVSEDGLTYRFTLRNNALWSDGVPVLADDFVYGWERVLMTDTHGAAQLSAVLESVAAESDKVLVAVLKQPCPWFLKLCAEVYTAPVRRDLVETYGGDWTNEANIVVSGAYTIESWVHDDHMVLRKNPCYYDRGAVPMERIVWHFGGSGEFTANVSDTAASGRVDKAGVYYLYLNANAVRDWRVRAAMLLALDRDEIAAAVGGGAAPAAGLAPAGILMTDGTVYHPEATPMYRWLQNTYPAYDLTSYEGRCTLALDLYNQAVASGTWGYGRTLRFRYNDSAVNETVVERCTEDWLRVLGLTVTAQPMNAADYETMLATNTFDVAYLSWMADYDDPMSFLQIMERGGSANYSAWGDQRYDAMLEQTAVCDEDRDSLLLAAECALFEEERFAVCPVYWFGENYGVAEGITGIAHSAHGGYWFGSVVRTQ